MKRQRNERQSIGQAFHDGMDSCNYAIEHAILVGQVQDCMESPTRIHTLKYRRLKECF